MCVCVCEHAHTHIYKPPQGTCQWRRQRQTGQRPTFSCPNCTMTDASSGFRCACVCVCVCLCVRASVLYMYTGPERTTQRSKCVCLCVCACITCMYTRTHTHLTHTLSLSLSLKHTHRTCTYSATFGSVQSAFACRLTPVSKMSCEPAKSSTGKTGSTRL